MRRRILQQPILNLLVDHRVVHKPSIPIQRLDKLAKVVVNLLLVQGLETSPLPLPMSPFPLSGPPGLRLPVTGAPRLQRRRQVVVLTLSGQNK